MMLAKFRERYPLGSLVGELVKIDRSTYIVRVLLQVDNTVLATALAGADTVEAAEDAARQRAIAALMLDPARSSVEQNSTKVNSPVVAADTTANNEVKPPSIKAIAQKSVTESNDEPKNVNFPKAESAVASEQTQTFVLETTLESNVDVATWQNPQPTATSESAIPSTTLFDDTFTAEIPESPSIPEDNYIAATSEPEPELDSSPSDSEFEAMDFNDIKQKTDIEIKRLGWTKDDGREFLKSRYGKRSRLHLTDEQLLEFLRYLEKLPNPVS